MFHLFDNRPTAWTLMDTAKEEDVVLRTEGRKKIKT